jgi:hypothetical protein
VITTIRRLPAVLTAIIALALSASLAFAGQPVSSSGGLTRASTFAGKSVPVRDAVEDPAGDQDEDADADADAGEDTDVDEDAGEDAGDSADAADNCTTDPTGLTPEQLAEMTHGSVVCWAAHQTDWDTSLYANKGAWVSSWAKQNHGHQGDASSHGSRKR